MALAILFIAIAIPRFFSLSLCWAAHQITSGRPAFYTFLDCQFRDLYFWPSALENETFSDAPFLMSPSEANLYSSSTAKPLPSNRRFSPPDNEIEDREKRRKFERTTVK